MDKIEILKKQEELLVFEQFTAEDAWKLGSLLVETMKAESLHASVSIRLNTGYILFAYGAEGTELLNQIWMEKKFETVKRFGKSSLRCCFEAELTGQTLRDHRLEHLCAFAPGAVPIKVKKAGMIGAVSISGLPGFRDHDLAIRVLSNYLAVKNVPMLEN